MIRDMNFWKEERFADRKVWYVSMYELVEYGKKYLNVKFDIYEVGNYRILNKKDVE